LFDVGELLIMAEYHEDVMTTPPENLLMAFDYVKKKALNGKQYHREDIPKVSLELKKFLSKSTEEQYRSLVDEKARLENVARAEQALREKAEKEAQAFRAQNIELDGRLEHLRELNTGNRGEIDDLKMGLKEQISRGKDLRRLVIALFSMLMFILVEIFRDQLIRLLGVTEDLLIVQVFKSIFLLGVIFFVLNYVHKSRIPKLARNFVAAAIVVVSMWVAGVFSMDLSKISDAISVVTTVLAIVAAVLFVGRGRREE
jgi:hypothetical protein